ncbi:FosX/FosE/FosI family fosfomycin resistance hydrolase [Enterococcus sp. AZ126]|uniref:FosX/FosE/FosI family fosfomycin resistance hydrolase n=1 Tax=Enterococcus sp. AZ126 TaxID=2774635 RepID=UPI003F687DBB
MISHITFIVQNLDKATLFFEEIFTAKEVYSSGVNTFSLAQEKFFLIDDLWIAIMQGDSLPIKTYNHVAFKIEESEYDNYLEKINALGLEIKEGRQRVAGEANSIYFYDFDHHLFELHTGSLEERLKRYQ